MWWLIPLGLIGIGAYFAFKPGGVLSAVTSMVAGHWYAVTVSMPQSLASGVTYTQASAESAVSTILKGQGFAGQLGLLTTKAADGSWTVKAIGPYSGPGGGLAATPPMTLYKIEEVRAPLL